MADETRSVLQAVDEEARRLARRLVRGARHAALATLSPETGYPLASRVSTATDGNGHPLILVSALSAHSGALAADPRCSLLFGEPGRGDPLRHPRITLCGRAERLERSSQGEVAARRRFLARHPEAELYVDFADFRFLRIVAERASLNGGFARAFALEAGDLTEDGDAASLAEALLRAETHMNADHGDAVDAIARRHGGMNDTGWRIVTSDRKGFEIAREDRLARIEFGAPITAPAQLRKAYVDLVPEPDLDSRPAETDS